MIGKHSDMFFSTSLRRDAKYHREQTLCHSERKMKELQI